MSAVFVTVRIEVPEDVDSFELVENCNYQFSYDLKPLESEITEVFDASGQQLF